MDEKENAKQFPKAYYARHMQAGLCGYEGETILVEVEAMKAMCPSFVGKPVFVMHQPVSLEVIKEQAAGYVSDCFYNEADGWLWLKFIAVDDEAHDAIARGWSVSNAYAPLSFSGGGTWHNCKYDREITKAEFTHLAIVPNPRYENAKIMTPEDFKQYQEDNKRKLAQLTNSKEEKRMFKLFKTEKKAVDTIDAETMVELSDGREVSIGEMINAVSAVKKVDAEAEKMNAIVDVGGEKIPLKELVSLYQNAKSKKNQADEGKEYDEEEKKENEEDEEKKNEEDEEEKQNGLRRFDELKNAHYKATANVVIETGADKLARGLSRYGSGK